MKIQNRIEEGPVDEKKEEEEKKKKGEKEEEAAATTSTMAWVHSGNHRHGGNLL